MFIIYGQYLFILTVCLIMGVALLIFGIHHTRLISSGRTTAENIKVGQLINQKNRQWLVVERDLLNLDKKLTAKQELELTDKREKLEQEMLTIDRYGRQ